MDRRQRKTRATILAAFSNLLAQKSYNKITVQAIIDAADIGRTTFYAHFETKDALLEELLRELFGHIIDSALDRNHPRGLYSDSSAPQSVFCHLLQHLAQNQNNILGLLSCESNEIFLRYFKERLNDLVRSYLSVMRPCYSSSLPEDFLVNHISSSFVEMILWWLKGGRKQRPEELDAYFHLIIDPVIHPACR